MATFSEDHDNQVIVDTSQVRAPEASPFFDGFAYWLLAIGVSLSLIDWLLGPLHRQRLQRYAGDWWVKVEELTIGQYVSAQARWLLTIIDESPLAIAFAIFMFFIVLLGPAGLIYLAFFDSGATRIGPDQTGYHTQSIAVPMLCGLLAIWFSLWVLRTILRRLAVASSVHETVIGVVVAVFYAVLNCVLVAASVAFANYFEFQIRPLYHENIVRRASAYRILEMPLLGVMDIDLFVTGASLAVVVPASAVAVLLLTLPPLWFAFSKVTGSVLRPVVSTVLARFYDSPKGVLTTIAIFGTTLAKFLQESAKRW